MKITGEIPVPTQEIQKANLAGRSSVLLVAEVVEIVREWVDLHARSLPDFAGAYLWGGITAHPQAAPFHLYRDVDVVVVVTKGAQEDELEVFYRGIILEIIWKNLDSHQDAEVVLADPSHGPNMATTQILADPTGILTSLHHAVAEDYSCSTEQTWNVLVKAAAEGRSLEAVCGESPDVATPTRLELFKKANNPLLPTN